MLAAMKRMILFVPFLIAACTSSGTSKQEASKLFASAGLAMASAQSSAVSSAHGFAAPTQLPISYSGPCAQGGTVGVTGSYDDGSGSGQNAAFDMSIMFNACKGIGGTLDGSMQWTSTASSTGFSASMTGNLDWTDGTDSASCAIDVQIAVTSTGATTTGTVCGYNVAGM